MNCQICSSPTHILYLLSPHSHSLSCSNKEKQPKPCGDALSAALTSLTLDRLNEVPGIIMYKCHAHIHNQPQPNCELRRQKKQQQKQQEQQQRKLTSSKQTKTRRKFCRFFSCVKKLSARCALRQMTI